MNERTLVVEQEPILDAILVSPGSLMVTLYGRPGHRYLLQSATALDGSEVLAERRDSRTQWSARSHRAPDHSNAALLSLRRAVAPWAILKRLFAFITPGKWMVSFHSPELE
jgi:hypothetical protein